LNYTHHALANMIKVRGFVNGSQRPAFR